VINSVATVYGWKDYFKPVIKTALSLPDSLLDAYTGNYVLREDSIRITRTGKQLVLHVNNSESFTMYFSGEKEFFMRDLPMEFRFERDDSGKVAAFYMKQGGNEFRGRKL
jgi:hypothetical protein